jgi:hypothetical protein
LIQNGGFMNIKTLLFLTAIFINVSPAIQTDSASTYTRLDDKPTPDEPAIQMLKEILQRLDKLEKLAQQLDEIKRHLQVLITK